jgi:hypothetical protein
MASNFNISNESSHLTITGRQTVPLIFKTNAPIQRKGSLIFDQSSLKLYYSDGTQWIELISSSSGNLLCISDADGNTSVCTDTSPTDNSNIITFKTDGVDRAIFNPDGVFIATAGVSDPTSVILTAGKVAHFEGDINVTGVVDPTGVQFTEQSSIPGSTNNPGKGMIYVNDSTIGNFNNTLTFVDSLDVSHTLGDMMSPVGLVTDNSIIRFDGTTGKILQSSPLAINDTGSISNVYSNPIILDGNVSISQNLSVMGTTTTITSENLLVNDNCIYLNNGNVSTDPLPGCIVVNYLATSNSAAVVVDGFMAGTVSVLSPSVVTNNAHTWVVGDIIQISGAANDSNNGLFEVYSYSSPILSITGIGGPSPSFNFFQNQFVTDATPSGTITQVNIAVLSSGVDGEWEASSSGNNVSSITFTKVAVGTSLSTAGTIGSVSLVNGTGVGPDLKTKGVVGGAGLTLTDDGDDLTFTVDTSLSTAGTIGSVSLVNGTGVGPDLKTKGIVAGTGLTIDSTSSTDIIITNSSPGGSSITLNDTSGGITGQTLISDGIGPSLTIYGILGGNGITTSLISNDIVISSAGKVYGQLTQINSIVSPGDQIGTNSISNSSYTAVTNFATILDLFNNMTSSNGLLQKSGGPSNIIALVSFQLGYENGGGNYSSVGIQKNSTLISNSKVQTRESGTNDASTISGSYIVNMSGNDTINLAIRTSGTNTSAAFYSYKLSVMQIFP